MVSAIAAAIGGVLFASSASVAASQQTEPQQQETGEGQVPDGILTVPVRPTRPTETSIPTGAEIRDAEELVRDLRSTYIISADGNVLSLADWVLGPLDRSGDAYLSSDAAKEQFLGNMARAALGLEPVKGSTNDMQPAQPFGPMPTPPKALPAPTAALKTLSQLLGMSIADDSPRLVRERLQKARATATPTPRDGAGLLSGPYDAAMTWHLESARDSQK